MAIITGKLRDVWMSGDEPVLVIAHPKSNGTIIREHINIHQRSLTTTSIRGNLRIGDTVQINATIGQYHHNQMDKSCLTNITKIQKI